MISLYPNLILMLNVTQKGRCGDTVEGYPEPALQQKTEGTVTLILPCPTATFKPV